MWLSKTEIEKLTGATNKNPEFYTNCAGYAFGTNGWYLPGKDQEWIQNGYHRSDYKGGWRNFERSCVKFILKDFPELRLVPKKEIDEINIDVTKYEIIAFRIRRASFFCDFHFMKCEPNGDWTEKCGHNRCINRYNYEDIYDIWNVYDGKLFFFVRPRPITLSRRSA